MQDMLVRLMELPDTSGLESRLRQEGILFRKPIAPERNLLTDWTKNNFSAYWASEMEVAFSHHPVSCILAQANGKPVGFACYETTARNFFGPTGVLEDHRGSGIGKVLLVKALQAMKELGYAYAIIGGVGPAKYYQKAVGAVIIDGSERSIYDNLLRKDG